MKKKGSNVSNKQRDTAISELYQIIDNMGKAINHLSQGIEMSFKRLDHYIDWRRDGKRYRRYLDKQAKKQRELQANEVQQDDKVNEQNMEASTADQG